ncbi:DUF6491 family protein [Dyella sp. A6]|uniref:DUF6491 family protein n=1 Tax=Dyella aluminiiresistens TaxID=3069105 RepID=UPI002E78DCB1|nr:DUF6491 family protein [Dyella sp. A6]
MSRMRLTIAVALAGLVAACSSVPLAQREQQRLAAYEAAAGAPVDSFRFFAPMWSWEPLSETRLVVYTRPDKAWLLDLDGACQNLEFANAIGLSSYIGQVSARFDRVYTGRGYIPCTIMHIRPVDVSKLKIEQAKQREIDSRPRPAAAPKSD